MMLYRLKSAVTRMIRRREYIQTHADPDNMASLSSVNSRCLHTNDKRLLGILFVVFCFSVLLQKTVMNDAIKPPTTNFKTIPGFRDEQRNTVLDTTLVTAYFDLGAFNKGTRNVFFTKNTYRRWARKFKFIDNPLIVYTDSRDFFKLMMDVRNGTLDRTKVFLIDRNSSWAFQRRNIIADIYNQKGYPTFLPNTVNPDYACAQIAKYDVISRAAKEDRFQTKYYAWIDVGYFRDRSSIHRFYLDKPKQFDETRIAVNVVYDKRAMDKLPEVIFKSNMVWVGGGLIFGTKSTIINYEKQFQRAVDYFLAKGLMNTDQQITYAMFSDEGRLAIRPEIELQLVTSPKKEDWFYLGFSMIRE